VTERRELLAGLADQTRTLVAFESSHRLAATLEDIETELGDRQITVARELTKLHEEIWRGPVSRARVYFAGGVRGEITLVIAGAGSPHPWDEEQVCSEVARLIKAGRSHREAVKQISETSGWSRRDIYQLTINLETKEDQSDK
jgi:16S rRNA (cytidine1402-2'-O)-methyltransferase